MGRGNLAISLNLTSLSIHPHKCVSNRSFVRLSTNYPLLSNLKVTFDGDSSIFLHCFSSFASLSSVELDRVKISESSLFQLPGPSLKLWKLVLSNPLCSDVSDATLCQFFKSCRSLRHLELLYFDFPADVVASDSTVSIPNVEFVKFGCCTDLPERTLFHFLNSCHNLEEIVMDCSFLGSVEHSMNSTVHRRLRKLALSLCRDLSLCLSEAAIAFCQPVSRSHSRGTYLYHEELQQY